MQVGEHAPADMRRLRSRPDREHVARRIVIREHGAGFDRHAAAAVLPDLLLEHVRRGGEGGVDIAIAEAERWRPR